VGQEGMDPILLSIFHSLQGKLLSYLLLSQETQTQMKTAQILSELVTVLISHCSDWHSSEGK